MRVAQPHYNPSVRIILYRTPDNPVIRGAYAATEDERAQRVRELREGGAELIGEKA